MLTAAHFTEWIQTDWRTERS